MRYAIYYVPPQGSPLAELGAGVLGFDLAAGRERPRLRLPQLTEQRLAEITRKAARYGFHATIKAPFRLMAGKSAHDLVGRTRQVAERQPPVTLAGLELKEMGRFLALRPRPESPALDALAAAFVRDLDDLRGPLTDADLARRNASALSPRQRQLLDRWGYPYVLDEYRFHMTLTDALDPSEMELVRHALAEAAGGIIAAPVTIDAVAIVEERDPTAPFRFVTRLPLRGSA
jgi:putative phosphonate metabolism protein